MLKEVSRCLVEGPVLSIKENRLSSPGLGVGVGGRDGRGKEETGRGDVGEEQRDGSALRQIQRHLGLGV
jgi:hypothetical protein